METLRLIRNVCETLPMIGDTEDLIRVLRAPARSSPQWLIRVLELHKPALLLNADRFVLDGTRPHEQQTALEFVYWATDIDELRLGSILEALRSHEYRDVISNAFLSVKDHRDFHVAEKAVWAIAHLHQLSAFDSLVELAASWDNLKGFSAAHGLAKYGRDLVGPILTQLAMSKEKYSRRAAAWIMGQMTDEVDADVLLGLAADKSDDVRSAAVWALGRFHRLSDVGRLVSALRDKSESVRLQAVVALREFHDPGLLNDLSQALYDPDPSVCNFAAYALERLPNRIGFPALWHARTDIRSDVRSAAVAAMGTFADDPVVLSNLLHFRDGSDAETASGAGRALSRAPADIVFTYLVEGLTHTNGGVQAASAYGLGSSGNSEAVKPLLDVLARRRGPHYPALTALNKLAPRGITPHLLKKIRGLKEDGFVRAKAREVLWTVADIEVE